MYIYKPMKGSNLMQAIARVNRVFKDKEGGLIVDYVGIASALKEAMNDYTARDRKNYGDTERDDAAYAGHWFINANSRTAPQIVDKTVKPILDRDEVYSGCYARVSLNFYAFNSNGNKGVACGLGNIQKIKDGEPLGGRSSANDDFNTEEDDDFLS